MSEQNTSESTSAEQSSEKTADQRQGTGIVNVVISVIASIFGVQSDKNRDRDFEKGNASDYIVMGIVIVVAIMIGMVVLVNSVIESAKVG